MKTRGLFFCCLLLGSYMLQGQNCVPNPMYQDSTVGVFPMPSSDINPDGGIDVIACNTMPYEFVFTVIIQDSISIPFGTDTIMVSLSSASITNIEGLPNGLTYACEPADCKIEANQSGCLVIQGTPDDDPGDYPLVIFAKMVTSLGSIDISFPGSFFPGEYVLTLEGTNSVNCGGTGTKFDQTQKSELHIYPVPAFNEVRMATKSEEELISSILIIDMEREID